MKLNSDNSLEGPPLLVVCHFFSKIENDDLN